jgi:hypothetical protein
MKDTDQNLKTPIASPNFSAGLTCADCKKVERFTWEIHECPICKKDKCGDCIDYYAEIWIDGHRYYKCKKCAAC